VARRPSASRSGWLARRVSVAGRFHAHRPGNGRVRRASLRTRSPRLLWLADEFDDVVSRTPTVERAALRRLGGPIPRRRALSRYYRQCRAAQLHYYRSCRASPPLRVCPRSWTPRSTLGDTCARGPAALAGARSGAGGRPGPFRADRPSSRLVGLMPTRDGLRAGLPGKRAHPGDPRRSRRRSIRDLASAGPRVGRRRSRSPSLEFSVERRRPPASPRRVDGGRSRG